MAIVKYKNQSGQTYAYESISVWDPEKKQARPKRKYLGRVDPETGEIIATAGKRGRPRKSDEASTESTPSSKDYSGLYKECSVSLAEVREQLKRMECENESLRSRNKELEELLDSIHRQTERPFEGGGCMF